MKLLALIALFLTVGLQETATPRVDVIHDAGQARAAHVLAERAEEALIRLENEFGVRHGEKVRIYLASSKQQFEAFQPDGRWIPVWVAGVAYPQDHIIVMKTSQVQPGIDTSQVLLHELTHLVLGGLFGHRPVPTWLNEGLTMHVAGEGGWSRQVAMARAVASGMLIPLDQMVHTFPQDRVGTETAYAESYYFIAFLRDRYGAEILGRLIVNLGLGLSQENVLGQATGLRPDVLEDEFHHWLSTRFSIFWILTGSGMIWFLATLLIVAAWVARKRAAAGILRKWETEELDGSESDAPGSGNAG